MPVQIIKGRWCKAPGVANPIETSARGELPSGIPPPTRPHTPPMSPPWALSEISTGLGCLVQIAGHMAWGGVQLPHTGVRCPNLSSHGRGPHGRQNLLDMEGESKSSSRAGRLAQILLDMDFLCGHPSRHHHVQKKDAFKRTPNIQSHPRKLLFSLGRRTKQKI